MGASTWSPSIQPQTPALPFPSPSSSSLLLSFSSFFSARKNCIVPTWSVVEGEAQARARPWAGRSPGPASRVWSSGCISPPGLGGGPSRPQWWGCEAGCRPAGPGSGLTRPGGSVPPGATPLNPAALHLLGQLMGGQPHPLHCHRGTGPEKGGQGGRRCGWAGQLTAAFPTAEYESREPRGSQVVTRVSAGPRGRGQL